MTDDAVVFDLDGTLIDSEPQVRAAINAVLAELGRRMLTPPEIVQMMGKGAESMMEDAFAATGAPLDPAEAPTVMKRYFACYLDDPASHTVVFDGVREGLTRLRDRGCALGICTNKPSATTVPVLRAVGLLEFFPVVVTADDVALEERKPNGAHIAITVERMGADLARTVYVGDSEPDVLAAHDAGVPCILVSYGYKATELPIAPSRTVDRFAAVPGTVADLLAKA